MVESSLPDWLQLWHVPGIGPRTYLQLLRHFDHQPANVLRAQLNDLVAIGLAKNLASAIGKSCSSRVDSDLTWRNASSNHHIITLRDTCYPTYLREIADPPPILYVKGEVASLDDQPGLAMVGSRKATTLGKQNAFRLARDLAMLKITIVSGMAHGIDGQAHRGALAANSGQTIAVLASGLDSIYPPHHYALSQEIINHGALISEFPLATKPLPQHFPRRNRIISGLCLGVIVVEAALKSGSLITARYALEQNREVFALPGPMNSPQSTGCHQLIQDGAKLVTGIEDILVECPRIYEPQTSSYCGSKQKLELASGVGQLLDILEYVPIPMDILIEKSGLTPDQVSSMLIELEVSGQVVCDAYGLYSRSALE